jgi:hypothetical protein
LRAFVIGHLLVELDPLRRRSIELHVQPAARRRDRQVAISQPPHQVKRLPHRLQKRQPRRVLRHRLFDRLPHLRRRSKKSVRRHQSRERLVRPLEVIRVDKQLQPPLQIDEIGKHRPRQKLVPQRLPEALDLPQRLRVLRPTLDVRDPLAPQLLLEFRRAAPRRVLPPLVGQDLPRRPKRRQPPT